MVFFLITSLSGFSLLGNIFRRAGGVTTLGIKDLVSGAGEEGEDSFPDGSGVFRLKEGENLGIRLFFSDPVFRFGVEDLVRGEGARL